MCAARRMITSSTVSRQSMRMMVTGLVCPMRWTRAAACRSAWAGECKIGSKRGRGGTGTGRERAGAWAGSGIGREDWDGDRKSYIRTCGLKSESMKMTVSEAIRFRPTPPARVDSRKTKVAVSVVKFLTARLRSSPRTEPSRRSYLYWRSCR